MTGIAFTPKSALQKRNEKTSNVVYLVEIILYLSDARVGQIGGFIFIFRMIWLKPLNFRPGDEIFAIVIPQARSFNRKDSD